MKLNLHHFLTLRSMHQATKLNFRLRKAKKKIEQLAGRQNLLGQTCEIYIDSNPMNEVNFCLVK